MKTKVPAYNKKRGFSLRWALDLMKKEGARRITPEEKRRDPVLRKALRFPRT